MPKELTAQPCDLSHQLSDTFLHLFFLFCFSFFLADSDVIDIDKFFPAACCPTRDDSALIHNSGGNLL